MFPLMLFKVSGKSMEPDFREGDYVIVNRLSYFCSSPKIGDIVVVKHPKNKKLLIKRIGMKNKEYYSVVGKSFFSEDSRNFGMVKKDFIVGKVWLHFKI